MSVIVSCRQADGRSFHVTVKNTNTIAEVKRQISVRTIRIYLVVFDAVKSTSRAVRGRVHSETCSCPLTVHVVALLPDGVRHRP